MIALQITSLAVAAFVLGFLTYQLVADLLRYDGDPYRTELPTLSTRTLCALFAIAAALLATGYAALP
ncbi:hypothetical protein [Pseudosulfitobacter pseudonitzschiae]|uniref:hypothetical protein n=1 Tax=Pseudosulfitobacter pseudonitzschiae TaxID=1402135 RepID=UPI003B76C978